MDAMSTHFKGKILLTGANGKLGMALRALSASHCDAKVEWVGLDVKNDGDASVCEGTFCDEDMLDKLLPGCDAVIHTAALHGAFKKTHTPAQFTDVNVSGLVKMLEACLKHGVKRFVFSSTMEIQIGRDWMASGMNVVDEESTPRPDWIYPANKLAGEMLGKYYSAQKGIEFVGLRYMAFEKSTRPGPGLLARSIMVHDVAVVNLLAATLPNLRYAIFNIGPDTPITNGDIVVAMNDPYAVVEKYWPGASEVLRAQDAKLTSEDFWPVTRIEKAKHLLGWQPEFTFEKYLESLGWRHETGA
jgi:nucleoside-diphosphate-sugar epimerase